AGSKVTVREPALKIGALAALLAFLILTLGGFGRPVHPPFPRERVKTTALRDPRIAAFLKSHRWDQVKIAPLDRQQWRVTVQNGPYSVLDATVGPRGTVEDLGLHPPGVHPPGSAQVWRRPVLFLLTAVFVAALAVLPLRSLRNLDALVLGGGLLASLIFYDNRFISAHIFIGVA